MEISETTSVVSSEESMAEESSPPQVTATVTSHQHVEYDHYQEFDPYFFIKILPPLTPEQLARPVVLPRKTRSSPKMTLVLDLDETLVHCSTVPLFPCDLVFPVSFNGIDYTVSCRVRPHYKEFLEKVSQMFEVRLLLYTNVFVNEC